MSNNLYQAKSMEVNTLTVFAKRLLNEHRLQHLYGPSALGELIFHIFVWSTRH